MFQMKLEYYTQPSFKFCVVSPQALSSQSFSHPSSKNTNAREVRQSFALETESWVMN